MSSAVITVGGGSLKESLDNVDGLVVPVSQLTIRVPDPSLYKPMELASIVSSLAKDAQVTVQIDATAQNQKDGQLFKNIQTSFLLAGMQMRSEKRSGNTVVEMTAGRLSRETMTAAPIRVTLSMENDDDDDDGLIDEDGLLADAGNILPAPPAMKASSEKDDCSGREPCADCTCGRSSENKAPSVTTGSGPPTSSCGKCGLGDAFRCASCPYLGKPAFKPGEEHLVLDMTDDL